MSRNHVPGLKVEITIPSIPGHPLAGQVLDLSDFGGDLVGVSTAQTLGQAGGPGGQWSLQFDPRLVQDGKTWSQLIPNFAVVKISMWRPARESEACVMLGLRDSGSVDETYAASPMRTNSISGTSMGKLLEAFKLYTILPSFGIESRAFTGVKDVLAGILLDAELLTKDQPPQTIIAAVLDKYIDSLNLLVEVPSEEDPSPEDFESIRRTSESMAALGFLRYAKDELRSFDSRAKFPVPPTYFQTGSLWSILMQYAEPTFQELFVDTDPSGNFAELVFRPKPFINDGDPRTDGSLFSTEATSPSLRHRSRVATIALYPDELKSWRVREGLHEMFNLFWVLPGNGLLSDDEFKGVLPPELCIGDSNPSDLRRFGVRPMEVRTGYMPVPIDDLMSMDKAKRESTVEAAVTLFRDWQARLRSWYQYNPLFYSGTIVAAGRASYRIGDRLIAFRPDGAYEFYIEGVAQQFDVRTGAFTSTLTVTRGFRLGDLAHSRETAVEAPSATAPAAGESDLFEELRAMAALLPDVSEFE